MTDERSRERNEGEACVSGAKFPTLKGRISPGGEAAEQEQAEKAGLQRNERENTSRTYRTQQLENFNRVCVNVCLPGV